VSGFYGLDPHDPESIRRAASEVSLPQERRSAVVAALRKINGNSPALDELEKPGTVAVVTGQQVGLFGGPAYTLYKALTAIKLARQLTGSGIRAVPVFWIATEDHDLAEVDHTWVFNPRIEPKKLSARVRGASAQPVGTMTFDSLPLDDLRSALEGFPSGEEVLARVKTAYQPGRTMGEAFRLLLADVLRDPELIFIDPMEPAIRQAAAPLLQQAFEQAPELSAAVIARGKELAAAGYHAQVHFEAQTSLLMRLEGGRRIALRRNGADYFHDTRRYDAVELMADPAELSPNALLRPVMQDYLLPTVAYVGGPAEIAYFAQSEVLYSALLGRMPVMLPRAGFTILDERAYSLMERFDLTLKDVFQPESVLAEKIAAKLLPAELDERFRETLGVVRESGDRLRQALAKFDPTLGDAMSKSLSKIEYQIEKNRKKAAREASRRESQATTSAAHLSNLLYPERHLQERLYSFLPFLAKHGLDLIETLYEHTYRGCPDHLQITI
jgi:bacillithiol biosynthesis cysteine-adding enzyme BshC